MCPGGCCQRVETGRWPLGGVAGGCRAEDVLTAAGNRQLAAAFMGIFSNRMFDCYTGGTHTRHNLEIRVWHAGIWH